MKKATFLKTLLITERKQTRWYIVFWGKPLIQGLQMRPSNNLEKQIPADTY